MENIERISKKEIYKIYDYKTANYTFSSPLTMGAILAGAEEKETKKIFEYGIKLGRAFQIKDDILGVFGTKRKIGKSNLTDLQEEKKTILIWHAYRNCPNKDKKKIKSIFSKRNINKNDLVLMRRLISSSGALKYAQNEINKLFKEAEISIRSSSMKDKYKDFLIEYTGSLLKKH
jgi:geranylgeranyl diphosphate synthase type I